MTIDLIRYRHPNGQEPVSLWLAKLRDATAKMRIAQRLNRLALGNFGDSRAIREGVIELRIPVGPGYRVYLGRHGDALVVLLAGGDKSSQSRDIELALGYWQDWQMRNTS